MKPSFESTNAESRPSNKSIPEVQLRLLALFAAIKILFIFAIPLLDDEAYFLYWGRNLAGGYYDHPPMIGWINYLMTSVIDSYYFTRLFPFFTTSFLSYLIFEFYKNTAPEKALTLATISFVATASVVHIPSLNDTAVTLFGGISFFCFFKSFESKKWCWLPLACFFMATGFLAKYFAAFLGLIYVGVIASKKRWKMLALFLSYSVFFTLPILYFHLSWNRDHCWDNIMFNVINRHSGKSSFELVSYIVTLAALLGPLCFWQSIKAPFSKIFMTPSQITWIFSSGLFALISLKTLVGAHWLLLFIYPAYYAVSSLSIQSLQKVSRWTAGFSIGVVTILIGVIIFAGKIMETKPKDYPFYLHFFHPEKICSYLENELPENFTFMADGYSPASLFSHHCSRNVPVIFHEGVYGREFDKHIDFKSFEGKDIAVYVDITPASKYSEFFSSSEVKKINHKNGNFTVLLGKNFNYQKYKNEILENIKHRYYTRPNFLPDGKCYFDEKYQFD